MTPDAFARSALELRPRLIGRAVLAVRDEDEAADLVDGVIARILTRHVAAVDGPVEPYLQFCLTNALRDRHKNVSRRRTSRLDDVLASGFEPATPVHERQETAPELARAISDLPPLYRDAILRAYWSHETRDDIARGLGVHETTFRVRLSRARQMLARAPELQRYAGRAA